MELTKIDEYKNSVVKSITYKCDNYTIEMIGEARGKSDIVITISKSESKDGISYVIYGTFREVTAEVKKHYLDWIKELEGHYESN